MPEKSVVGMFFLTPEEADDARKEIDDLIEASKFSKIGWREVPVVQDYLGPLALENAPAIYQLVVEGPDLSAADIEIQAYALRR